MRPPDGLHHRLKRSQGGKWSPENILAACGSGTTGDHGRIEVNPLWAEERGYHCRPWHRPAEKPVLLHGTTWVYLTEQGTYERVDADFQDG